MKYSIDEIDEMRTLIAQLYSYKTRISWGKGSSSYENIEENTLEQHLRTHMLNGTTVKELEEKLESTAKEWEEKRERI